MKTSALMYHDVLRPDRAPSGFEGGGPSRYALSWDEFAHHLDRIGETVGAGPGVLDQAERPAGSTCVLTFDDGGASALDVGEELARRGWRGYFFVTTGLVGTRGFVDADGVRALDAMGHVVGSHSVTHPDRMGALPPADILREWRESCDVLAELLGAPVTVASVPGGFYRRRVAVAAAQAGIRTLFTSEPVRTTRTVEGCLLVGRYVIRDDTTATEAASAAAGDGATWRRQRIAWSIRKPAKILGGERYDRVRRALLARKASREA